MPSLSQLIRDGGRKYAVVVRTLELGFLLSLIGLLVSALEPSIAQFVAAIVGAFGMLGSASIVAYQGANAAQDWKSPTTSMHTSTTTSTSRPSGSVVEVPGA